MARACVCTLQLTVAFIALDSAGASFRKATQRLQGTVAGAVFGYIVLVFAAGQPWILAPALCVWVALCTYVKTRCAQFTCET